MDKTPGVAVVAEDPRLLDERVLRDRAESPSVRGRRGASIGAKRLNLREASINGILRIRAPCIHSLETEISRRHAPSVAALGFNARIFAWFLPFARGESLPPQPI